MRISALAALMILTTVILSACGQDQMATLDDRSNQYYGRNGSMRAAYLPQRPIASSYRAPAYAPAISNQTYTSVMPDAVTTTDLPPPSRAASHYAATKPAASMASVRAAAWQWPVEGKLIKSFAEQREGITIAAKKGTPIHASASGEVAYVGSQLKDYGNLVIVRHVNGEMSSYAHASEIIVTRGDHVKQGDVLGYVGQTGRASQSQLHFAIRSGDRTIDPLTRLPQQMASN